MTDPRDPSTPLELDPDALAAGDRASLWHHIKPHRLWAASEQMVVVAADGLTVRDHRGREYLDVSSGGVWCVNVGYGRERIARAVYDQLEVMPYFSGAVGNVPAIALADRLCKVLPGLGKVYLSNSGSEANEKAFKMVRQAARIDPGRRGKFKILYRDRDYHGTTLGALSAGGQAERKQDYGPFVPGFVELPHALCYRCPFDRRYPGCDLECARAVETVIEREGPDTVGACLLEPITAGGGIIAPVPEYFPMVTDICRRHGVWLMIDEVVCGFGRTGKFWGHQHFDVEPDVVTMAKGMASAYAPISATMVTDAIYDTFLNDLTDADARMNYFRDISTYGGCAGAAAAALANLDILEEEGLVERSRVMGEYLLDRLRELLDLPLVGDVRGRGLFCGVELVRDKAKKTPIDEGHMARIIGAIAAAGVLVGRTASSLPGLNTTVNLAPALTISRDQIDRAVAAVLGAIEANPAT